MNRKNDLKDLKDMMEAVATAISIFENEREFFRRSAQASDSDMAKALFQEIAEDIEKYILQLEERKGKLAMALQDLTTGGGSGKLAREKSMRDPVCGMLVDSSTQLSSTFQGKKYYFCSPACQKAFELDPGKYA